MSDFKDIISRVAEGETLSISQTEFAFNHLMSGDAQPSQIAALLMGLRVRGETQDEFVGAINAMRAKMLPVDAPDNAIDIVGTGGDSKGSLNISTATALVVASTGVKVAKHGNRALSSKSGAADTLIELG
ncbi:MAG: anthranilate phosphoribosyltransferase, partial [Nitratireductor sp.]